jgi:hypothetical protein
MRNLIIIRDAEARLASAKRVENGEDSLWFEKFPVWCTSSSWVSKTRYDGFFCSILVRNQCRQIFK